MVGKVLKEKREALGLSLEEVSSRTKIKVEFLQHLEEENYAALPDPYYLTGFLRRYALYLGMDAEALIKGFSGRIEKPRIVQLGPLRREYSSSWKKWRPLFPWLLALLAFLLLVIPALFYFQSHRRPRGDVSPSPSGTSQTHSSPGKLTRDIFEEPKHTLSLYAVEETWIIIQADDQAPRDMLLLKGQTFTLPAQAKFLLTLGNAAGVEIVLDGKRLPPAGFRGQVIRDMALP